MNIEMSFPRIVTSGLQPQINSMFDIATGRTYEQKATDADIYFEARNIIFAATQLPENLQAKKEGGCLVIGRRNYDRGVTPTAFFYGKVENSDPEFGTKNDKYIVYALGKTAVLVQNPEFVTSRQNKDLPEADQLLIYKNPVPEGAIALSNGMILAFSGFAGYVDEAICVAIALKCCLINDVVARDISEAGTGKSYETAIQLLKMVTSDIS